MSDDNNLLTGDEPTVPKEEDTSTPIFDGEISDDEKVIEPKEGEAELEQMTLPEEVEIPYDPKEDSGILLSHTIEELGEKLQLLKTILSKADYDTQLITPSSQITAIRKHIENASTGDEFARKKLVTNLGNLEQKYVKDDIRLMDVTPISSVDKKGATISGQDAIDIIRAKNKNVRKVFLYNSGIYLLLKGPSLDDLNSYYNSVSLDVSEYGREFGAYFYMFSDLLIKKATIALLKELVIYTNVKNFKRDDNLIKAISIHDYDTILWAIGTLMYKSGFPYTYTCVNINPTCAYTETTSVDLKKIRYNNYTKLPTECISFISENKVRTHVELAEYRKKLGFTKTIDLYDQWKITTKVPTLFEFCTYADIFNGSLIDNVHLDNKDTLYRYIQYNFYKVFVPWIDELRLYNEDSSINFKTTELGAITECLDTTQLESTTFGEDMEQFILDTAITTIAIPFSKCPSCGYVPTYVKDGYISFDVQKNFFIQLVMRLARIE